jgi:diguanylate cyclase (GGDEF)-like protein
MSVRTAPRAGSPAAGQGGNANLRRSAARPRLGAGDTMKVLIADDDALLRQMLLGQLAGAGHEYVFASNGREAWELLQRECIRMVIVDWMMPEVDGPELIRRIRDAGWPGYTYIILLTARNGREDVVEGLNLGADDYMTKPFRPEELLARMGVGTRILQLEGRLSESLAREEALATRDTLTGLPNRRALAEHARIELSRAARARTSVGLIMMDLDHFKRINDQFGHAAGDAALRRVTEVLQENRRDYDFTGRWGGEEFLVVLPGTSLPQAAMVAERIRKSMEAVRLDLGGPEAVELRASLGVVCAPPASPPVNFDDLLHQADAALYRAKREGRNCVRVFEAPK